MLKKISCLPEVTFLSKNIRGFFKYIKLTKVFFQNIIILIFKLTVYLTNVSRSYQPIAAECKPL